MEKVKNVFPLDESRFENIKKKPQDVNQQFRVRNPISFPYPVTHIFFYALKPWSSITFAILFLYRIVGYFYFLFKGKSSSTSTRPIAFYDKEISFFYLLKIPIFVLFFFYKKSI